uniref:Serine-arginine protein 55 n=1 Tax=Caligus rogercresseyi TaxID=217165 RepID=C1BRA8_CALRO|nr:Serine-arginine protein 55 [Caligus rogercresseyi]
MKERKRGQYAVRPHRGCRVYVGGLPSDVTTSEVGEIFAKYRNRFDVVLKTRFAFVEFDHNRDADHALERLDGTLFRGQRIVVEIARGPKTADKYLFRGGMDREPTQATWVQKYGAPEITQYKLIDLKALMRKAGRVTYAQAHRNNLREGIVCFENKHDMLRAIDIFDDYELCGRRLDIEICTKPIP